MEQEKISWSPEAEIKVTGREFEFLARLVSMFEIPLNQLSIKDYQEFFFPAVQVSQDILKRMLDEGIATKGELPEGELSGPAEGFTVLKNDAE